MFLSHESVPIQLISLDLNEQWVNKSFAHYSSLRVRIIKISAHLRDAVCNYLYVNVGDHPFTWLAHHDALSNLIKVNLSLIQYISRILIMVITYQVPGTVSASTRVA